MSDRSHAVGKQGQIAQGIFASDPAHHGQGHDNDRGDVIDGQFGTDHAGIASASQNPFDCREVLAFRTQVEDSGFAGQSDENRVRGEGVNGGNQGGDKVCPRVRPSLDDGRCESAAKTCSATAAMSSSRVRKRRYSVATPTPARAAISSSVTLRPRCSKARAAASRMRP